METLKEFILNKRFQYREQKPNDLQFQMPSAPKKNNIQIMQDIYNKNSNSGTIHKTY